MNSRICYYEYDTIWYGLSHNQLWISMIDMGFPLHIIDLIRKLYKKQQSAVRSIAGTNEWFKVTRGVRQGCILSHCLFNLYTETAMREALEAYNKGFQLGGRLINNLRYADDAVVITTSPEDLQELVNRVSAASEKIGLLINSDKTKVMISGTNEINRPTKISLNGEDLEEVESFVYLGSIFTMDVSCTSDIRKRLAMGRSVMQSLSSIWRSKDISTTTKIRLLKALVWSVATYGCEGWTL